MSTKYLIATEDTAFERRLRQALGSTNGDVRRLGSEFLSLGAAKAVAAVAEDPRHAPEVLALGPGVNTKTMMELARRFDEAHPEISVVIIAKPSPTLLASALRAGVRDVISPEAPDEELQEALTRARRSSTRRRENLIGESSESGGGRIITVVSPKGGSGKTTSTTNLAVGLAQQDPGKVVIVDLDLTFGDVANALRLVPEHSMRDVIDGIATIDAMGLKAFLTPHSSELYALCAPDSPALGEHITSEQTSEILRLLATEFEYVIVDTSAGLNDHTLAALEMSTDILFICTMDVPSVRSLRKVVQALDQLGMTTQQRHFVLNRADSRVGLDEQDIERTVGMTVDIALPSSRVVPLAMNQGVPIFEVDPKAAVSKQLENLVQRINGKAARQGRRRWGKS